MLAPHTIGKERMPHLSPVGSLTNLLTDLSSDGYRKNPEIYGGSMTSGQTTADPSRHDSTRGVRTRHATAVRRRDPNKEIPRSMK